MSHLDHNTSFQRWVLTEQEILQGQVLTTLQKQVIQNQIVAAAEEKLALTFDPNNQLVFVQREGELQGRILALKYLLDLSNAAEEIMLQTPQE